jgi:hypothetical protein
MAISYFVDEERSMVIGLGSGHLEFSEWKSEEERLRCNPKFSSNLNQLLDVREVTSLDLSSDEARMLAGINPFSASSRRAFVANKVQIYGKGQILQACIESAENPSCVSVFYDVGPALDWLGV